MSKIKNGRLDQYGAEPLEQQQFEPAGVERVKLLPTVYYYTGQSDISHDIVNRRHQFLSECKFSNNQVITRI